MPNIPATITALWELYEAFDTGRSLGNDLREAWDAYGDDLEAALEEWWDYTYEEMYGKFGSATGDFPTPDPDPGEVLV